MSGQSRHVTTSVFHFLLDQKLNPRVHESPVYMTPVYMSPIWVRVYETPVYMSPHWRKIIQIKRNHVILICRNRKGLFEK